MKRIANLSEAKDVVLQCRDLGHAWEHVDDGNIVLGPRKRIIEFSRTDKCNRCSAERTRTFDVDTMDIIKTRMKYPDEYLMTKGHRVARRDARMEVYTRIIATMTIKEKK